MAFVLLVCWGIFINIKPFSISQHQWQNNIISGEKFIFDVRNVDNLIVGSSLSLRLQMDSLPNFYNLALSGQSLHDGLNILVNKKELPENVFIEMNFIDRGENLNFKEIISSPILTKIKSSSKVFRTDKQPLAYLDKRFVFPIMKYVFYGIQNKIKGLNEKSNVVEEKSDVKNSIFEEMLDLEKKRYSGEVDIEKMNKWFESLTKQIEILHYKGVNIIFFEMPVNYGLEKMLRAEYLRKRVRVEYPNIDFIRLPNNVSDYITRDGLHLTKEESAIYTSYFKIQSSKIINSEL